MAKLKACIFDLDGVIVDTAKYHFLAWQRLAAGLGITFTKADNERLKGISRMASLNIILDIGGVTLKEEEKVALTEKKNTWYLELIKDMDESEILPGVEDLLNELRDDNIGIALGSSSKNAKNILRLVSLEKYFETIVDGTVITNAKPDPEVFLTGAKNLDQKPEDCVVFEDAEAGIQAAINAGMKSIGCGEETTLGAANFVVQSLEMVNVNRIKLLFA